MCKETNCKKQPVFNYQDEKLGKYCSEHKLVDMVNVKSKTCIHENCKTIPTFNEEGEKVPKYCSVHKLVDMIDIKHQRCLHPNCKIRATFNEEGEKVAKYCSIHKLENMVNVKDKTCIHPNCKTKPVFNEEGETKGLFCSKHKSENMVNVVSKTCIHPNCKRIPVFNEEGETKGLFCSKHKLNGMVNVRDKHCIHSNCKTIANFNFEGEKVAKYCSEHKLVDMIDVKNKACKTHLCNIQVKDKYDGYCLRCYIHLFPDKPVSRNYKTKEYSVVEYVQTKFPNFQWIADKIVNGGCSKRRPDLLLDLGCQIIIVEIDENQHSDYDCSCENKRIMELSQDLGHRPIVFIRFNPDDYEKNGTTITSCWGQDKKGLCVVKKSKKSEWIQRLNVLEEQINYWINQANTTNKIIETIQLFYDV